MDRFRFIRTGMTHHVHILEMNGDSYRLKQSKRRQRPAEVANAPANPPDE
jgi:hypothetical protein